MNAQKLQVVDKFTYLGSTLSRTVHIDDEVTARTAKASVAFGRLRINIWERNGIRLDTKLKVYKAVVLPTLLYACETWTVYQRHAKKLNHFHLSCLRKLLKIRWQDKIQDTEVLKKAKMQSVHTLLKLAQLRWTGHVTRMPDERLPKKVLYAELQEGKRSQGGQKKRYKNTLKASLKDFNIPIESLEQAAQDRTKWRYLINKGASQFEEKRICEAERKRKERKARAKEPSSVSAQSEFTCSRLKHNQGGHFSKSMLYVNTLLVLTPIIILLSELNSKFQMLSIDIKYVQVISIFKYFVHDQTSKNGIFSAL